MAETPLLVTLREYRSQLENHLAAMRERHEHLQTAWLRLREVYEGDGAEVFSEAFEAASARLAEYADRGSEIERQLERKIDELGRFESSGSAV